MSSQYSIQMLYYKVVHKVYIIILTSVTPINSIKKKKLSVMMKHYYNGCYEHIWEKHLPGQGRLLKESDAKAEM